MADFGQTYFGQSDFGQFSVFVFWLNVVVVVVVWFCLVVVVGLGLRRTALRRTGPHPSGPTLSGPTLSGPHPFGPHFSGPHFFWVWDPTLLNLSLGAGLAKVGQLRLAKVGLSRKFALALTKVQIRILLPRMLGLTNVAWLGLDVSAVRAAIETGSPTLLWPMWQFLDRHADSEAVLVCDWTET